MLQLPEEIEIYLSLQAVDMRKAIDGLTSLIEERFGQSPQSSSVFLFRNKNFDKVKALIWDKNGFVMHYKRLEKGRFRFPRGMNGGAIKLNREQLSWLFAGLDFMLMEEFPELDYTKYF